MLFCLPTQAGPQAQRKDTVCATVHLVYCELKVSLAVSLAHYSRWLTTPAGSECSLQRNELEQSQR